jgi:hypothetical protein
MYNAPHRPGFARTGLGKILSRFQLWSWNSIRFRNEVYAKAKIYGFKPGTEGFETLKRQMSSDMVVFALGSAFMYSLFDNALPAPYNYFQQFADWIFGTESEQKNAFFQMWPGWLEPLQLITPPIARIPMSGIRALADDDYAKFSEYYLWTMFPFGRMVRTAFQPEKGLIANPMRLPEQLIGLPVMDIAKKRKKMLESDYEPPRLGK